MGVIPAKKAPHRTTADTDVPYRALRRLRRPRGAARENEHRELTRSTVRWSP